MSFRDDGFIEHRSATRIIRRRFFASIRADDSSCLGGKKMWKAATSLSMKDNGFSGLSMESRTSLSSDALTLTTPLRAALFPFPLLSRAQGTPVKHEPALIVSFVDGFCPQKTLFAVAWA